MTTLAIEADLEALRRFVDRGKRAIDRAIDNIAEDLRDAAARESESASSRVAQSWKVKKSDPPTVESDIWFAHFLTGTRSHGPRSAPRLVFFADGEWVRPAFVHGVPSNPFDERAIEEVESHIDAIFSRAFVEVI